MSANPSITLDLGLFDKAKHFPHGFLPSGVVVARVAATGKYGPYDPAASDGRQTPAGLWFSAQAVRDGQAQAAGALFWHGLVQADFLPIKEGAGSLDADARTALAQIRFI